MSPAALNEGASHSVSPEKVAVLTIRLFAPARCESNNLLPELQYLPQRHEPASGNSSASLIQAPQIYTCRCSTSPGSRIIFDPGLTGTGTIEDTSTGLTRSSRSRSDP